jgi:hypothetical protein
MGIAGDYGPSRAGRIPPCLHCKRRVANRPRGLCWGCYYDQSIRDLYPLGCTPGGGTKNVAGSEPVPTDALPGSEEKMAVLAERVRLGQKLHHPMDGRKGVA